MVKAVGKKTRIVRKHLRLRKQGAARIRATFEQNLALTIAGILKLGHEIAAVKETLPRGEFMAMIRNDLPFSGSKAIRLMKISADPKLTSALNSARGPNLPLAWRTLYELTKMSESTFDKAMETGAIHRAMTRDEVKTLRIPSTAVYSTPTSRFVNLPAVTYEDVRLIAPHYTVTEKEPEPPLRIVSKVEPEPEVMAPSVFLDATAMFEQLETIAANLKAGLARGDVVMDIAFEARARALGDTFYSMFDENPRSMGIRSQSGIRRFSH